MEPEGWHNGVKWVAYAQNAYEAYASCVGWKNFRGDPMPAWEDLPDAIRTAWEAATRQVQETTSQGQLLDTKRWESFSN